MVSALPTLDGDVSDPVAERGDVRDTIIGSLMLAFDGLEVPADVAERLASAPAAGVTLFRYSNVADPGQIRSLTAASRPRPPGDRSRPPGGMSQPLVAEAPRATCRSSSPPTRRVASSSGWGMGRRRSPGTWPSAQPAIRG